MNLSTEKKIRDLENRLVVAKGRGMEWDGLVAWGSASLGHDVVSVRMQVQSLVLLSGLRIRHCNQL